MFPQPMRASSTMIEHLWGFNSGLSNKWLLTFLVLHLEGESYEKNDHYLSGIGTPDHRSRPRGRRAAQDAPATKRTRMAQAIGRRLGFGHSGYRAQQRNNQVQRQRDD